MTKSTLDVFISRVRGKTRGNEWVLESKFQHIYVRYGDRAIADSPQHDPKLYRDVLDLANLTVEENHRGTGVFTALVARLRETYPGMHLYVENAVPEFQPLLLRLGFIEVLYDSFS